MALNKPPSYLSQVSLLLYFSVVSYMPITPFWFPQARRRLVLCAFLAYNLYKLFYDKISNLKQVLFLLKCQLACPGME